MYGDPPVGDSSGVLLVIVYARERERERERERGGRKKQSGLIWKDYSS